MHDSPNPNEVTSGELARLRQLFEGALERPVDERRAWLESASGDDPCLIAHVERMLAAEGAHHSLLDLGRSTDRALHPEWRSGAGVRSVDSTGLAPRSGGRELHPQVFNGGELFAARFRILGLLGRGGMGEVYAADDLELGQRVALKFLAGGRSRGHRARLRSEVRLARQIAHPNVCRVYDIGEADGHLYLSMEYVAGEDLSVRLARDGRVGGAPALEITTKLCAGLAAAHGKGILHRDLKPGNVMIDEEGEIRIMDFGLALAEAQPGESPAGAGTPAYMSPEQLAGSAATARSDIYALGLVLYELFTGSVAFPGTSAAELLRLRQRSPVVKPSAVVPGLNPAVEQVILRCLDPEPSRRPAAAEIAASLRGDLGSANLGPGAHSQPYRRRPGRYLALIAASLVVSAAGAQLWVAGPTPAGRAVAVSNVQVQPLTLDGRAALGAISPDGRLLVYQTYEQLSINVRRLSDSADRTLVPADRFSRISSLTVGPRNEFVDVVAITGDATLPDLWRIPLHGGGGTRLVRDVVSAVGWSPDGRQMAYLRGETTTRAVTLVVADAEGCHSRDVVTRRPPRMFYGDLAAAVGRPPSRPAWSPDGRSITLAGYSEATLGNASELVTVDAATGRERHSVGLRGTWSEVAWLDERRYLLVGGDFPLGFPTKQVWITDLAGRHRAGVTREFGFFMNLSLTGDRTTAIAKRFSRFSGISVSDGSGRNTEIRVPLSIAAAAHPRIDDAGGLTYTALTPDGGSRLYYLGPDGKVPVEVVEGMPPPFTVPFHDVSADGRTIIFKQLVEPQGLFRVDRDGDQLRLVESDVAIPRLTPDGATVLFTRNTVPGLYEISVGGGPIRRVTARAVPDGRMDRRFGAGFSISPTGRRLLIQTGTPGLLALCDLPACEQWTEVALPSLHWSPGGTGVVYVDSTTIFEQLLAGGPPRVIATPDGDERVIDFSWSRDGSRLATARGWYPNDMVSIKGLR